MQIPGPVQVMCESLDRTISVWSRDLTVSLEALGAYEPWLSSDERARAARFTRPALRERYIIGRGTLRLLLSNVVGLAPGEVCIERGRRGRPQLHGADDIDFNVSHTRDRVVFVIASEVPPGQRVGIDVEHLHRTPDVDRLSRRVLTEAERARLAGLPDDDRRIAFLATWTCKEAMSKATGDGIGAPFGKITVDPFDPPRVIDGPGAYAAARWQLHRIEIDPEHVTTVAVHRTA